MKLGTESSPEDFRVGEELSEKSSLHDKKPRLYRSMAFFDMHPQLHDADSVTVMSVYAV